MLLRSIGGRSQAELVPAFMDCVEKLNLPITHIHEVNIQISRVQPDKVLAYRRQLQAWRAGHRLAHWDSGMLLDEIIDEMRLSPLLILQHHWLGNANVIIADAESFDSAIIVSAIALMADAFEMLDGQIVLLIQAADAQRHQATG